MPGLPTGDTLAGSESTRLMTTVLYFIQLSRRFRRLHLADDAADGDQEAMYLVSHHLFTGLGARLSGRRVCRAPPAAAQAPRAAPRRR